MNCIKQLDKCIVHFCEISFKLVTLNKYFIYDILNIEVLYVKPPKQITNLFEDKVYGSITEDITHFITCSV